MAQLPTRVRRTLSAVAWAAAIVAARYGYVRAKADPREAQDREILRRALEELRSGQCGSVAMARDPPDPSSVVGTPCWNLAAARQFEPGAQAVDFDRRTGVQPENLREGYVRERLKRFVNEILGACSMVVFAYVALVAALGWAVGRRARRARTGDDATDVPSPDAR